MQWKNIVTDTTANYNKWAIPEKKLRGDFEDMEFPGYQRNNMWNFQGLIKNEVEFPKVTKKKSSEISRGLGFWS